MTGNDDNRPVATPLLPRWARVLPVVAAAGVWWWAAQAGQISRALAWLATPSIARGFSICLWAGLVAAGLLLPRLLRAAWLEAARQSTGQQVLGGTAVGLSIGIVLAWWGIRSWLWASTGRVEQVAAWMATPSLARDLVLGGALILAAILLTRLLLGPGELSRDQQS